jgi:hypothetical protein
MTEILNHDLFLVREHVGLFKAAHDYDIVDPDSGEALLECREQNLGWIAKLFRFSDYRRTTPFDLAVSVPGQGTLLRLVKGIPVFYSRVKVIDEEGHIIGGFRQRSFSLSGSCDVLDAQDKLACRLTGGLSGREYRFETADEVELAHITKKWAGLSKEILTSAGDYLLKIDDAVPKDSSLRRLILASAICVGIMKRIDIV